MWGRKYSARIKDASFERSTTQINITVFPLGEDAIHIYSSTVEKEVERLSTSELKQVIAILKHKAHEMKSYNNFPPMYDGILTRISKAYEARETEQNGKKN